MEISGVLETAKITVHWDHLLAPTNPDAGKVRDDSWRGMAKKVAGLALVICSYALFRWEIASLLLFNTGLYHVSRAYQKTLPVKETPHEEPKLSQDEIDQLNQFGIDTILEAATEGKKIGLVIGRDKDQPMPVEDNWLWVAGNIAGDPAVLEDRVDLQLDFNQLETMQRLAGTFDKVVVDFSTLKAISGAWASLRPLLKPLSTSQLITETVKGLIGIERLATDVFVDCPRGNFSISIDVALRKDFESAKNTARLEAVEKFRHYLKNLFDRVELYDDNAPFPTRQGCHTEKASHFVLTGPARRTKERVRVFERR